MRFLALGSIVLARWEQTSDEWERTAKLWEKLAESK
jgi:hypothetical protein